MSIHEELQLETLESLGTRVPPSWKQRLRKLFPGRRLGCIVRDLILSRLIEAERGRQGVRRERRKRLLKSIVKAFRRFEEAL